MRKILFLFIFVGLYVCPKAEAVVVIEGTDSLYSNKVLVFYRQDDPVSETEFEIGRVTVAADGKFKAILNIEQTTLVYAFPGIYKIFLFTEPGWTYSVVLPPFIEKTKADVLNPYFTPVEVQLGTLTFHENDLNIQIRMFNDAFYPYYNKHVLKALTDQEFEQLDKDIDRMEKPFSRSKDQFFNDYRKYKYAMLRYIALQNKSKKTSDTFFRNQEFLYNNPAFVELFNMVYGGYFAYFSRVDSSGMFNQALGEKKSLYLLRKTLSENKFIQPESLLNMVILKNLYVEFYDDNYSRTNLLEILDSFLISVNDPHQHQIAQNIYNKVTRLLRGFAPPAFALYDIDSNVISIEKFKGKYVYLNFCSCYSYTCMNDFVMLKNLYEKHNQYLEVVTIIIDDDIKYMQDFVKRSGYKWTFLHYGNQPEIIKSYDIRGFPTYYLVDMNGKLVMSPSPAPSEDFEGRLFKELKAQGISVYKSSEF